MEWHGDEDILAAEYREQQELLDEADVDCDDDVYGNLDGEE